jgi:hypothetical protein
LVVLAILGAITFALSMRSFGFARGEPGMVYRSAGSGVQGAPVEGGPSFQGGTGHGGGSSPFVQRVGPGGPQTFGSSEGMVTRGGGVLFRLLGALGPALPIVSGLWFAVLLGLTLLAAWFIWRKQKRWALNLAIVLAIFVLLGALPAAFMGGRALMIGWLGYAQTGLGMLKVLACLPIIVLGMLPSTRDFFS